MNSFATWITPFRDVKIVLPLTMRWAILNEILKCERIKAILEETKGLDQKLVAIDGTVQALVDGAHKYGSNACHVADQAEAIRGRYADLH